MKLCLTLCSMSGGINMNCALDFEAFWIEIVWWRENNRTLSLVIVIIQSESLGFSNK